MIVFFWQHVEASDTRIHTAAMLLGVVHKKTTRFENVFFPSLS